MAEGDSVYRGSQGRTHSMKKRSGLWPILLAVVLPLSLLALDTAAGFASGWRPEGAIERGALGLLLVALALLAFPVVRRILIASSAEAALLVLSCALAWGAAEVGAHVVNARLVVGSAFHTRGPHLRRTLIPRGEELPGITGPSTFTTDGRGIRAPFPPGPDHRVRWLCIGGSTTECVGLDDGETWPALLMDEVGRQDLWVGNVGISGFSTPEHARFLKTSPLLAGVDGVVLQIGINDLWRYLAEEEEETWRGRFLAGGEKRLEPVAAEGKPNRAHWRPLWSRSRVVQLYHSLRVRAALATAARPEEREGLGGEEYRLRRAKRAAATITDSLPPLEDGVSAYGGRIDALIELARERRLKVIFTTQPVLWDVNLSDELAGRCWFGWLPDGRYLSIRALREAMDAYNTELLRRTRAAGVPCVELSPMNGNGEYFYDDCHFTEAGAREVARRVAALLGQQAD